MNDNFLHEYDLLPYVDEKEIRMHYYSGYYDGPVTGMLIWNEKKYWFEMYREMSSPNRVRNFVIMELSKEDMEQEEIRQQLWVECCGNFCFYLPEDHKRTKPIELYYTTYPSQSFKDPQGKPIAHMIG